MRKIITLSCALIFMVSPCGNGTETYDAVHTDVFASSKVRKCPPILQWLCG